MEMSISYVVKQSEVKPNCLLNEDCITLIKAATVTDSDSPDFAEGTLTVSLIKGASPDDRIFIYHPGKNDNPDDNGVDIRVHNDQIRFQGEIIGSFQGGKGTEPLLIKFNQKATPGAVEALLPRIVYQNLSASQNIGSRSIQVQLNDGDNGTSKPILETVLVVDGSNAPSVTVPSGLSVKENKPLHIPGIVINDPNSQNATVTLAVTNGTLIINSNVAQGLKVKDITGNKTKQVILKGKLTEINATLANPSAILYQSAKNFTGDDSLNVTVNDNEKNSKQKGILLYPPSTQDASTASGNVGIIVNPENAPSIVKFPSAQTVNEDSKLEIGGIVVKASNAKNPNSVTVTLKVENGTLSIKDKVAKGLTSANIKGNKSPEVTLTGNVAQINTTLANAAAITYQGNNNFNGTDSLKITVSDGKQNGAEIVGITVNPVNDPPIVDINNVTDSTPPPPSDGSSLQPSNPNPSPAGYSGSTNATIAGEPGQKNIRSGPGLEYSIIQNADSGDRVQVIETKRNSDNFLWYRIYFPESGADGWIAGNLLAVDGQQTLPPPKPPSLSSQTNATVVGKAGTKNLRSGAGTIYGVIGKVSTGDRVQIMGSSYDGGGYQWFQVYDPQSGTKGWIAAQLINRD